MTARELAAVDVDRLAAYLSEVAGTRGRPEVSLLSGGASNLTYLAVVDGRELVVRRRPLGRTAPGAHDMSREHRVLAALAGTPVPVPRVYGYTDDESLVGAPCYVMDRAHGHVIHEPDDAADLSPAQATAVCDAVVDTLVAIHAVDVAAVGLADLGRPGGFIARRLAGWLRQWDQVEHRDIPAVAELGGRLQQAVPADADTTLVHGDYRLGNLMVTVDPVSVVAVFDWEMSTLGDPMTDLAHLAVYWEPTAGRVTHPAQLVARRPGFRTADELAERYAEASGRPVGDLGFYLAFEHWRAAIIKEGIHLRGRDGEGPARERALAMGEAVGLHLEEAADILRRASDAPMVR